MSDLTPQEQTLIARVRQGRYAAARSLIDAMQAGRGDAEEAETPGTSGRSLVYDGDAPKPRKRKGKA